MAEDKETTPVSLLCPFCEEYVENGFLHFQQSEKCQQRLLEAIAILDKALRDWVDGITKPIMAWAQSASESLELAAKEAD